MLTTLMLAIGSFLGRQEPGASSPDSARFEGWFHAAVAGGLDVPASARREARACRYVFLGGFRGERMPGYFAENIAELVTLGIPRGQIYIVRPSSDRTIEANADAVRAELHEIADEGPEPLVVIAHSRGACDALAFALADPAFVEARVRAMYLIQGPFGGSGVAGFVNGSGEPIDRRMRWNHRVVVGLLGRMARTFAGPDRLEAMGGMTPEASASFWSNALTKDERTLSTVGARTFFIRSAIHPSRQRSFRRAVAWYVQTYRGPGDGVVALRDQSIPGFGTVLATIEAGHPDLTSKPTSRARRFDRRALSRSIVMAVGLGSDEGAFLGRPELPVSVGGRLDGFLPGLRPRARAGLPAP